LPQSKNSISGADPDGCCAMATPPTVIARAAIKPFNIRFAFKLQVRLAKGLGRGRDAGNAQKETPGGPKHSRGNFLD
jgi:hypothetical protein